MTIGQVLFSFRGRMTRRDYWLKGFLVLFPVGVINSLLASFGFDSVAALSLSLMIGIASLWPSLALVVKRLHDRNRSGWFAATMLIPVAGIVFGIWIIIEVWFLRGTWGPNRFGPDPLLTEEPSESQSRAPDPGLTAAVIAVTLTMAVALAGVLPWASAERARIRRRADRLSERIDQLEERFRRYSLQMTNRDRRFEELYERLLLSEKAIQSVHSRWSAIEESAVRKQAGPFGDTKPAGAGAVDAESLRSAIEEVLDERENERELERSRRFARLMANRLLSDIEATAEETDKVIELLVEYRMAVSRSMFSGQESARARAAREEARRRLKNRLRDLLGAPRFLMIERELDRTR